MSLLTLLYVIYKARNDLYMDVQFDKAKVLDIKQSVSYSDIRGGRSSDNGRWYSLLKPFELYAYTAFLDERATLGGARYVRVISVIEMVEGSTLYCGLWYHDDEEDEKPQMVKAQLLKIGFGVFRYVRVM